MRSEMFRRYRGWIGICLCSLVLIVGSGLCRANDYQDEGEIAPTRRLVALAERVSPAVVGIRGWGMPSEPQIFNPEGGFPDPPILREWQGAGVVVDALVGFIVTANHLVANATVVKALTHDGRELDAVVLVRSERDDVALLRVAPDDLRALTLENAGVIDVGEPVVAVGNPRIGGRARHLASYRLCIVPALASRMAI